MGWEPWAESSLQMSFFFFFMVGLERVLNTRKKTYKSADFWTFFKNGNTRFLDLTLPTRLTTVWCRCDYSHRELQSPPLPTAHLPIFTQHGISMALGTLEFAMGQASILCGVFMWYIYCFQECPYTVSVFVLRLSEVRDLTILNLVTSGPDTQ